MLIIFAVLGLLLLLGLIFLITWLAVKPKNVVFTIDDASIRNFNLKNDHVTGSFYFDIRARNRNKHMKVYYDAVEVSTAFDGQSIAFAKLAPFRQPKRNVTVLETRLDSRDVALAHWLSKDVYAQWHSGQVKMNVRIKAKIRFKVGSIRWRKKTVRVLCPAVPISFRHGQSFQKVDCDMGY
ncbi:Uncharacterized protein At1g08160 [Linum grandiflorum]